MYRFVRWAQLCKEIDVWWWLLSHSTRNQTVEINVAGQRMVFTADPENTKAILATQFGDYGKGEPFHEGIHRQ